ncbi:mastermind-like protein 2 isoform X1 [Phyllopteryx taeniolatus]|uniref:mastermind-like protein 2 isoform X1 n=1 Tax=Phyllopteryx taeniolatus TaxID=161469 RepID=UPI002AD52E59|nr:mastermind-like protein 2 isoform X1 [Phyllopteryx taeniolatus]
MGEASPAQSAAGAFAPMPAGVRGSAVPQLHSAIVERLRARIELCRRHHSTCEERYLRGQAERADREQERTLRLLDVAQQRGQATATGTRRSKGGRGAAGQPPPEYGACGAAAGERRRAEGDHKMSTRIALQGSLRRKLEGHAPSQNCVSDNFSGSDFKRVRLEAGGGLGPGPRNHNLSHAHSLQAAPAHQRKNYVMPDVFNVTLKEMKKEPVEAQSSCDRSHPDAIFDFKDEGGGQIDPELQDLFDELTKSVPPLNDLDFEKMLKQDDAFGLDLGRPSSVGLCSPMERPIKMEQSPDYAQVHGGSPQLRPASAGPSFALTASPASAPVTQKAGTQAGPPRSLPCWPEISHAEQLKQMAANQHQPSTHLHPQHHHVAPAGLAGWGPKMGPTFQDKGARPRLPQQSKDINNCLFKSNGVHHVKMKPLVAKPSLHFSPKPPPSSGHMMSLMAGNKSTNHHQLQLSPPDAQNQTNPPPPLLHFHNQQQMSSSPALLHGGALSFKLSQHHQGVSSGPGLPTNGIVGQPHPTVPAHRLKGSVNSPTVHRQLSQPQRAVSTSDKDNSQDQFNRHLTRPPPDYKRSVVGVNIFPGPNPSQSSSAGSEKDLQSMSCHHPSVSSSHVNSSDQRFDCHPPSCIGQYPNPNRMALTQNKARFLAPNTQGNSFGMTNVARGPHPRPTADPHSSRLPGQPPGGMMANMSWCSAGKPTGLRRQVGTLEPPPNHQYQQRAVGPPSQVAPDLQMMIREAGSRPAQPHLNQPSPEQRVPAAGNLVEAASGGYQSGRANRVTFDFLPEGDNTVPGINTDSDFIDSLLKSGSGNDDWMKDINLDEILGSHV